jgi:hypothetical protein
MGDVDETSGLFFVGGLGSRASGYWAFSFASSNRRTGWMNAPSSAD